MDDKVSQRLHGASPYPKIPFEGRDDLIEVFLNSLEGKKPDEHRILVFHGISGIGKTRLLEELAERLEQKWPAAIHATLDFETVQHRDIENGLFYLRKTLKQSDIDFNAFDIAYAIYWREINPQIPLASDGFPLWGEAGLLADVISIAKDLPGISLIPKSAEVIDKGYTNLKKWWTKRGQPLLQEFAQLKPFEMEKKISIIFADDVKHHFIEYAKPIVVFVDTYQALWGKDKTDANKFSEDEWIRNLVENLPETYWVIAGHDKLSWGELDKDWDGKIKPHPLAELAEDTVFKILKQTGITDEEIQKRIFEGSEGVPFYVQLSIENYFRIISKEERQPVVDDFGDSFREIFERFAKHLDKSELATLRVLSCARFWDKELFSEVVRHFSTGYEINSFGKFCEFSFIREGADSNTFVIHDLFKNHINDFALTEETRKDIHEFFFNYYDNQLKEIDIKNITEVQKTALTEAFFHGSEYKHIEDIVQWCNNISQFFYSAAQWLYLSSIYEKFMLIIEKRLPPNHIDYARCLNSLAKLCSDLGKYSKAEPLFLRALQIYEENQGVDQLSTAVCYNQLAELYRLQGKYLEAESFYRQALKININIQNSNPIFTATCFNNLALLYLSKSKYQDAESLFTKALEIYEKVWGPEHNDIAVSLNNLASLYGQQGKYHNAISLHKRALSIQRKNFGNEHPYIATSINNIALMYSEQGLYSEAKQLHMKALGIREKNLGSEHPETLLSLNNLATVYFTLEEYNKAEQLFNRVYEIRKNNLGQDHPDTATSINNLAKLYQKQGKFNEAELMFKRSIEIKENTLGAVHPDIASSIDNLADLYIKNERYSEVEKLQERALLIREKLLGVDHPDVARSLNNIASFYRIQGKNKEAETLYKRALHIYKNSFGDLHPHIATVYGNMSVLYEATEQFDKAKECSEKAEAIREQLEQ